MRKLHVAGLKFPDSMASVHGGNDFYLAGGEVEARSMANLRKISHTGSVMELSPMPQEKQNFGMAYSAEATTSLYTVGGFCRQNACNEQEVTKYSFSANKWTKLA